MWSAADLPTRERTGVKLMYETDTDTSSTDILVVTQFFPPEGQGGGHRWQKFVQQHADTELNYRVVCPPPSYPFGEFERTYRPYERDTVDGVPVTRLWTYQPDGDASDFARILNYGVFAVVATLYVLCTWWRYDCVVTMSTPHTTFLPGIVAKALGRRWIVDLFDTWLDNAVELDYVDEDSCGYRFVAWLERRAFHDGDHAIVLTPTMGKFYQEKYGVSQEQTTAVPFGVDRDLFTPKPDTADANRITYVGNLGTFYAFEPYLEAFARLDDRYELFVVGWGERRSELETLCVDLGIDDRVTFTGRVSREEVVDHLQSAALNWVPLQRDCGLDYARPTKLLEGMAIGTPYVASSLAEIEYVTEQSGGGLTVENDPEDIAAAMETVLSDPERHREMADGCVEFIESEHRWEPLADRVADVLRETV